MDKIKNFFSSDKEGKEDKEGKKEKSKRRESRRSSILPSVFSNVDPILCLSQNKDPKLLKKQTQATPRVIRRGSNKFKRSGKNAVGNSIAFMSEVSSVSYSGPVINYQYTFKLKYGTVPNYDED